MAGKLLKVCFIHPGGRDSAAAPDHVGDELASRERPDNVRVVARALRRGRTPCRGREAQALGERPHACGCASSTAMPSVKTRVAAIAKEWEEVTNLTLDFVTSGAAEIRISFRRRVSRGRRSAPTR